MKKTSNNNYKDEFNALLKELEGLMSDSNLSGATEELNKVYSICHKIDETASLYGINSLSALFSPIEKGLSNIIEEGQKLENIHVSNIISCISLSYSILEDISLKNIGLKTNFDNLKDEIIKTFLPEKDNNTENTFSNKRFQDIFIEEANDLINQLEEQMLQLESEPDDLNLVDNIFRIMHTLKGNSNMFGFKHLGEITHHLENIYDAIRSNKLKVSRLILAITLQCIDHFRNLIDDVDLIDPENKSIQKNILDDISKILDSEKDEQRVIEEIHAESTDLKSFYIFFKPEAHIFDDGSNPLYFIYDLYELGSCEVLPVTSEIPAISDYNTDICYTSWHILISTSEPKDVIAENFMFLREESQPPIELITKGNILGNAEFIDKFKELAVVNKSIISDLPNNFSEELPIKEKAGNRTIKKSKGPDASIASIRVASAKIDLMMNLISELVTKQAELSMLSNEHTIPQLQEVAESIESISRDLRDNAFSISLIPLEKSVLRFQRLVRDVSTKFNKKVNFVVEGKETELDKTIIEKIVDPIMHILRNSIDHGIEIPEERIKLGKPEAGTIKLKAYPSGAHVVIEISDDGSGINVGKVKKAAINKGYISVNDDFSTDEMLKLIMSPGFSTTENVSEVSGRGVGMDVVYQKINEIRGELDISTSEKVGTTITIKLPLTISIIDSLLVMIGSVYYLIPLSVVERCAEVTTPTITESPTQYLNLDGEYVPFIDLHKEFEITEERQDYQRLILVNYKDSIVALVVNQITGNHQAVLKSLGQAYRKQEIISGASILGNGEVALVMDTNKLVQDFMANREDDLNKINLLNMQSEETEA